MILKMRSIARRLYALSGAIISASSKTQLNKIVFICNYGSGYLCNPKYIAEALNRLYPGELDLVLLVNDVINDMPAHIRQAPYRGISALRELATARVWIDNCRGPKYIPKRNNQFYIQTWHGAIGPKRIEKDVANHLSADYVKNAKHDGSITDLMFANNSLYETIFKESFWYEGPIIRCGMPRNRPYYFADEGIKKKVYSYLGIDENIAICLYAPTFRVNSTLGDYMIDAEGCVTALEKRFGKPFVFVYRLHPNLANQVRPGYFSQCIDATHYEDAQELFSTVDVMISDYSSSLEDFAQTGRPGFVYAPDYAEYIKDRGFYYPMEVRPFPVAENNFELFEAIRQYDENEACEHYRQFFKRFDLQDDGMGDEVIARIVRKLTEPDSLVADALEE